MKINELQALYERYEKKYSLPSFDDIGEFFEIDRIDEEPQFFLRTVRKILMEKVIEMIRMFEFLMNPSIAPPFFLQFVKKMSIDEHGNIDKLYKRFIHLELNGIDLDMGYNEKNEAEHILSVFNSWKENLFHMREIIALMRRNFDEVISKKEKSYFG